MLLIVFKNGRSINENNSNKIGIIIFCRNTNKWTLETTKEIGEAVPEEFRDNVYPVFINDASNDDTFEWISKSRDYLKSIGIKSFVSESIEKLGLSKSMLVGIKTLKENNFQDNDFVTQLPGNHQVTRASIVDILNSTKDNSFVVFWRENLESRPILKRLSSKVLQIIVRSNLFPEIIEVTGNYVCTIGHAEKWIPAKSGHSFGLWLIYGSKIDQIQLHQKPIRLIENIRTREIEGAIRKWPKLSDVYDILKNINEIGKKIQ